MYCGWKLSDKSRTELLDVFIPTFNDVIAHHITHSLAGIVPEAVVAEVVGYALDPNGIEALVVSVDGEIARPKNRLYHITWSLDRRFFKPVDSNRLLENGYSALERPIPIDTVPFWVDNNKVEHFS